MSKMKFVCVCIPTLGNVSIEFASALRALMLPLNTGYCESFAKDNEGNEVAESRNACVTKALGYCNTGHEVTHLLWLDDDVIFARTALLALHHRNKDIVSGVYFTKGDFPEPLIFPSRGGGTAPFVPDEFKEVWGHGMGLTLIKLDVYREMQKKLDLPLDKYGRTEWYKTPGSPDADVEDDVLFAGGTEDLYFLHQAQKCGFQPYIDTSRHTFGWHWDGNKKTAYPEKQWQQYQSGKDIVWQTPDGPKTWYRQHKHKPVIADAILVGDSEPHTQLIQG